MLKPQDVAQRLHISIRQVYYLIETGKLKATKVSERGTRISEQALKAYLNELNTPSET